MSLRQNIKPHLARVCRIFLMLFFSIIIISTAAGCDSTSETAHLRETRILLDTYCTIIVHGDVDSELLDRAFAICQELEALFSMTIEGSDVWRINNAGGEPVTVDLRTIEILEHGLAFGEISDGLFDITIGRLSRLWDFGNSQEVPSYTDIAEALATVDYSQVILDRTNNTVHLLNPDAWIDLGALAKGYIARDVAVFLAANGADGALVDIGRDVVTFGKRYDGNPWRLAVQKPFGANDEWLGIVEVSESAVLGSGTYERQFEEDGVIYHHILDATTGMPVISDVVSATLITQSAIIGEGFSTIAVLVGSEGIEELIGILPGFIGAVIVLENGEVLTYGRVELLPTR